MPRSAGNPHFPRNSVALIELGLFFPDQDGDKKLTLSEFISLPVGTVENQQAQDIDDDWVRDRRKEFQEVIDANHDGIVTMEELEVNSSSCWIK